MENIGINPAAFFIQLINFSIMVLLLGKLLYKPIIRVLDERKKKIEQSLEYEVKIKKQLEESEKKREEILDKAKDEARKIVEEGKKLGKNAESEILEKARNEATSIVVKGRKELESDRADMEKTLRSKTVEIAAAMVERLLNQVLSGSDQRTLIDKKLKDLARMAR